MEMIKNIIGIIAIILAFIGYVPYIRDIIKRKTTPHLYSWILWGAITLIVFALQVSDGAGIGAMVTLTAALFCLLVIGLTLYLNTESEITIQDTFFLVLAVISLVMWLVFDQPLLSAILATMTDVLAFGPTIRKTWNKPHSETFSFYIFNTIRFLLATIALENYTIITTLYPIAWMIINGLFAVMLKVRRAQVG